MPIFCSDVNQANQEKLVPITRHNGASIVPNKTVMTLELVLESPENGPFWEQATRDAAMMVPSGRVSTKGQKMV